MVVILCVMKKGCLIAKRELRLILILFLFNNLSFSQVNLVNNPSFENYNTCNDCNQNITEATFWFQPNIWWGAGLNGGSDFYHACNLSCVPPQTVAGYQYPRTGNGFGGAGVFFKNSNIAREYIEISLTQSLISNKKYCSFFYTNRSEFFTVATDCLQLLFSVDSLLYYGDTYEFYNAVPHVQNPTGNIITDTLNWTLIKGIYTAIGNENFITAGCFLPKEQVNDNCFSTPNNCGYAYYFFDDFGVYELPEIEAGNNDSICTTGGSVQISASCAGCWSGLQYRWWPAIGLNDTTVLNPIASPTQTTTYYFGLTDTSNTVPCIIDLIDSVTVYVCDSIANPTHSPNTGFSFSIYPNPGQATVTLNFSSLQEDIMLYIYDARGRLVLKQTIDKGTKTIELNIADIASGVYILKLQNAAIKEIRKFVKT